MYQFEGQHQGVDYQVKALPGEGYTAWMAALSKCGTPLPDIEGRLLRSPGSNRNEPLAVRLAVHCGIETELDSGAVAMSADASGSGTRSAWDSRLDRDAALASGSV